MMFKLEAKDVMTENERGEDETESCSHENITVNARCMVAPNEEGPPFRATLTILMRYTTAFDL